MGIATRDGYGVDALGIRRRIVAGTQVHPSIKTDVPLIDGPGHYDPVQHPDHPSESAQERRDYVEREQTFRPDIDGSRQPKEIEDEPPDMSVGGHAAQAVNDLVGDQARAESAEELSGQALQDRARELDIRGRSSMNADELRAAIAEAESGGSTEEPENPTTDEGTPSEDVG